MTRSATMMGTVQIPFSELFKSTLETHGDLWCFVYYVLHNKMEIWEYEHWLRAVAPARAELWEAETHPGALTQLAIH